MHAAPRRQLQGAQRAPAFVGGEVGQQGGQTWEASMAWSGPLFRSAKGNFRMSGSCGGIMARTCVERDRRRGRDAVSQPVTVGGVATEHTVGVGVEHTPNADLANRRRTVKR